MDILDLEYIDKRNNLVYYKFNIIKSYLTTLIMKPRFCSNI